MELPVSYCLPFSLITTIRRQIYHLQTTLRLMSVFFFSTAHDVRLEKLPQRWRVETP